MDLPSEVATGRSVVYARVSSHHQRADLERQVARVTAWATAGGLPVHGVVTEVGSGQTAIAASYGYARRSAGVRQPGRASGPAGALWRRVSPSGAGGAGPAHRGGESGRDWKRRGAEQDRGADFVLRTVVRAAGGQEAGVTRGERHEGGGRMQVAPSARTPGRFDFRGLAAVRLPNRSFDGTFVAARWQPNAVGCDGKSSGAQDVRGPACAAQTTQRQVPGRPMSTLAEVFLERPPRA